VTPHLQFGYVSRVHGLHGEVVVRTFDPRSEVMAELERVWVKRRDGVEQQMEVLDVQPAPRNELRVSLGGVASREAAEELVGATLFAFREDLDAPDEGEFFQGDLIGLEAVDEGGEAIGAVEEIWNNGPVPNLVIRRAGREWVLPMVESFVKRVDLAKKQIVVELPEYV
jgi:16S rRNA processing protein RimM